MATLMFPYAESHFFHKHHRSVCVCLKAGVPSIGGFSLAQSRVPYFEASLVTFLRKVPGQKERAMRAPDVCKFWAAGRCSKERGSARALPGDHLFGCREQCF